VLPALRALAGLPATRAREEGEVVTSWSTASDRQQFVLAKVKRQGASWRVEPIVPRGSSDLFAAWAANAYIEVPEGTRELPVGAHVTFEWLEGAP
jgi:molybdopterin biosynthesis enzyme